MPIATGVSWFHDCAGGEFAFYPEGADAKPVAHPVRYNTALLMDTDTVFHGVDRVAETAAPVDKLRPGMRLRYAGDGRWVMADGDEIVAEYRWNELRYSVSWKAYCFADAAEQRAWRREQRRLERRRPSSTVSSTTCASAASSRATVRRTRCSSIC